MPFPSPTFEELEHRLERELAEKRRVRREELARDLLLKLVETNPGTSRYDTKFNVARAIEYTDTLLAELEATCDTTK